ncbi:hypothetical protein Hanom_Chr05g00403251 [Helianthus anomalus]
MVKKRNKYCDHKTKVISCRTSKPTIKSHYLVASRVGANTKNSDNKERRQRREGMFLKGG